MGHFSYGLVDEDIDAASIHNETLTLLNQPWKLKYDDSKSAITREYEVITTFMKTHNISATWEPFPYRRIEHLEVPSNTSYQLKVGSYHPSSDQGWGRGPPM